MGSNSNELPVPQRGIIPPLVTPLLDRDTLDEAGLERLIEHVLAGGVHGLFILGTSGEAPSLSYRLRYEHAMYRTDHVRTRKWCDTSHPTIERMTFPCLSTNFLPL